MSPERAGDTPAPTAPRSHELEALLTDVLTTLLVSGSLRQRVIDECYSLFGPANAYTVAVLEAMGKLGQSQKLVEILLISLRRGLDRPLPAVSEEERQQIANAPPNVTP